MNFNNVRKKNLERLSKEQLIKIIEDWDRPLSCIGSVCVSESKLHITSKEAIEKIRGYLGDAYKYDLYNENLGSYIDLQLGKISGEQYRDIILEIKEDEND